MIKRKKTKLDEAVGRTRAFIRELERLVPEDLSYLINKDMAPQFIEDLNRILRATRG